MKRRKEKIMRYLKFWDIISVGKTLISSAERKGKEEGIEEGRKEGIEAGRKEEKRLIVSNAKKQGLSTDIISSLTGLSIEEIERL
ncbi:hypothetical protein [Bacteroides congonensis]